MWQTVLGPFLGCQFGMFWKSGTDSTHWELFWNLRLQGSFFCHAKCHWTLKNQKWHAFTLFDPPNAYLHSAFVWHPRFLYILKVEDQHVWFKCLILQGTWTLLDRSWVLKYIYNLYNNIFFLLYIHTLCLSLVAHELNHQVNLSSVTARNWYWLLQLM